MDNSDYSSLFNGWAEWSERDGAYFPSASNFQYVIKMAGGNSDASTIFRDMDSGITDLCSQDKSLYDVLVAHYLKHINSSVKSRCRILTCSTKTYYARLKKAERFVLIHIGIFKGPLK